MTDQIAVTEASIKLQEAATLLSDRIHILEDWMAKLPGKAEYESWGPEGESLFGLKFARQGEWCLFCATTKGDQKPEWNQLSRSSLEDKMTAVRHFPSLIGKLVSVLADKTAKLQSSNTEMDKVIQSLPDIVGEHGRQRPT